MSDLIIGIHSIIHALNNPLRENKILRATEEGFKELLKRGQMSPNRLKDVCQWEILPPQQFDRIAQQLHSQRRFHYQRIPAGLLLEISPLPLENIRTLHEALSREKNLKILCLDRVSDIQNAAAILRTAAFYAVPFLLIARKGTFSVTPAFYRLASGATEHVQIVSVNNLSRTLLKLKEKGVPIIGLSEKGSPPPPSPPHNALPLPSLVLGAEGQGLSHAVERCVDKLIQLPSAGRISTLNVSVASALAMEKFWNTKRT